MTQADFITLVHNQLGPETNMTKRTIKDVLDACGAAILEALTKEGQAPILGLGTLKKVTRAARSGRNPKTGETIQIAEKQSVKFSPNKTTKEAVN